EYPHNLILSTFLYSGVVGLILLVLLILSVILKSIINYQQVGKETILIFLVSLTFMSVSGNSLFSSKLIGVLILLIICAPFNKEVNFIDNVNKLKSCSVESEK